MTCTIDIKKLKKHTAKDRAYIFLAGLDWSLDQVNSRILTTSPLLSLKEAYSQVRSEVQRQANMNSEDHPRPSTLNGFNSRALSFFQRNKPCLDPLSTNFGFWFLMYCNNPKHIIDVCWKKHCRNGTKLRKLSGKRNPPKLLLLAALHLWLLKFYLEEIILVIFSVFDILLIDSRAIDHMPNDLSIFDSLSSSHVKSVWS